MHETPDPKTPGYIMATIAIDTPGNLGNICARNGNTVCIGEMAIHSDSMARKDAFWEIAASQCAKMVRITALPPL
jgi:hypothetical protein